MVTTRMRVVIGVVLLTTITIAPAPGWVLTRAGRVDRIDPTPTPIAAAPTSGARSASGYLEPVAATASSTATTTATPDPGPPALLQATATAPTPIAEAPGLRWDAAAAISKPTDFFRIPCPAVEGGVAFTVSTPPAMDCVVDVVTAARGSPQAIAFLRQYQLFLATLEEHGRVDVGSAAAAWQNMGRPEPVFLNATPAMQPVAWLLPARGRPRPRRGSPSPHT